MKLSADLNAEVYNFELASFLPVNVLFKSFPKRYLMGTFNFSWGAFSTTVGMKMWHNLTEATFNNKRGKLPKVITLLSGCNLKLCQDFTICNSFKVKGWNDGSLSGLYPWQFKYADGGWWGYSWFYASPGH